MPAPKPIVSRLVQPRNWNLSTGTFTGGSSTTKGNGTPVYASDLFTIQETWSSGVGNNLNNTPGVIDDRVGLYFEKITTSNADSASFANAESYTDAQITGVDTTRYYTDVTKKFGDAPLVLSTSFLPKTSSTSLTWSRNYALETLSPETFGTYRLVAYGGEPNISGPGRNAQGLLEDTKAWEIEMFELRGIAVTNLKTDRDFIEVDGEHHTITLTGDISVYPNQTDNGTACWVPTGDITYRITIKNPKVPQNLWRVVEVTIPQASFENPDAPGQNGVIASFDYVWDGKLQDGSYFFEMVDFEVRAVANVTGSPTRNTITPIASTNALCKKCESLAFHLRLSENIGIPGALDTPLNSSSLETANPAGSMGYGWFSTENIRVLKPSGDDSELVYRDENGMTRRWLLDGGDYVPVLPDNRLRISRNLGSVEARYVVTSTDNFRREFNASGVFKREVDKNERFTTYTRETSPNYLKVEDDKGRVTYQHFTGSELQPRVINDDINPNLGRRVVLDYYMDGTEQKQLKSIEDLNGDLTVFVYNSDGRISERREELDDHHRSTFYTYDSSNTGRLASIRTSSTLLPSTVTNHSLVTFEHNVPFSYGGVNYITTRSVTTDIEDPSNPSRISYVAQDSLSRIVGEFEQAEDPDGSLVYIATLYEYNDPSAPGAVSGNPWLCTRTFQVNKGAETIYEYTAGGNVKKVIDNEGNETILTYIEENPSHPAYALFPDLVTEIRRPAPDRDNAPGTFYAPTKFTYNATNANLESVEDARGKFTYFRYNTDGEVDRVIDRRGFKTYFEYNDMRDRLSDVHVQKGLNPSPGVSEFEFEDHANFRTVTFTYNDFDELTQVENANGDTVKIEYDIGGRATKVTDGNDVSSVFGYLNQVLDQVTLPTSSAGVDASGNPLSHTGRVSKMEYDSAGRNLAILRQDSTHSPQKRASFTYDGFSQLRSLIRTKNGAEKGHTSSYDRQGRVLSSTDANGKTSTVAYEPFCVGYANTSARGVRSKVSFDTLCRLTQMKVGSPAADPLEVASASETRVFLYDDLGRLLKTSQSQATGSAYGTAVYGTNTYGAAGGSAAEREFRYNELDQLTKIIFEDGKEFSYLYDDEENLTQITENASSSTPKVTQFSYYGDGALYEVTYARPGGNSQTFRYIYDAGGRPLELWYPSSTGIKAFFSGPDGPSTEPGWDGNSQLKHLRYMKGANLIRRFELNYDESGNRIEQLDVTSTKATRWVYGYDWLDRLESVKKAEAATLGALGALQLMSMYTYDAADNRVEFQVPALSETYKYIYDDADNITLIEKKVGAGVFASFETFTPPDDDGNMTSRTRDGITTTYTWDDFNRLKAISTSDNSKKQSHTFGISGFRRKKKDKNDVETTEYAAGLSTEVSKATSGETITYLQGGGGIVGFERSSDGAMFYFLTDALGTVRDVIGYNSTTSQWEVRASYEFSEYGQRIATSESGVSTQKSFVGAASVEDEVADTGLMMMGHRFYAPDHGRFLNRDPIGFAGGLNLYEYANSSPSLRTDPSGLVPPLIVAAAAAVAPYAAAALEGAVSSVVVGAGIRYFSDEEVFDKNAIAVDAAAGATFSAAFNGVRNLYLASKAGPKVVNSINAMDSEVRKIASTSGNTLTKDAATASATAASTGTRYLAASGSTKQIPGLVQRCVDISSRFFRPLSSGKNIRLWDAERIIMESTAKILPRWGKESIEFLVNKPPCLWCTLTAIEKSVRFPRTSLTFYFLKNNGGAGVRHVNSLMNNLGLGAIGGLFQNI